MKSSTGSYLGYSFEEPECIVRKVVVDHKEYGVVQRAMMGISYRAIDDRFIESEGKELGIEQTGGLYVASVVNDSAAAEAGIRKGDIITAIDGAKTDDASTMMEKMAQHRPNDKITVTVKRNGSTKDIEVTLKNRVGKNELMTRESVDVTAALGGKFADAGKKLCDKLEIRGGVQVIDVKRGGLLERARVREGFVITHINDRPVKSLAEMERITDKITNIDGIYPDGRTSSFVIVE